MPRNWVIVPDLARFHAYPGTGPLGGTQLANDGLTPGRRHDIIKIPDARYFTRPGVTEHWGLEKVTGLGVTDDAPFCEDLFS